MEARISLDGRVLSTLLRLPDPGEPLKGGVRADGDDAPLEILKALGFAENRNGWWRKTKGGVLYLRECPVHGEGVS